MPTMRGKAHLRTGTWLVAVLLALVCSGSYRSQNGSPNLKPFKPRGWSDVIVVSNRQGSNLNSRRLAPSDILFVDFAVINGGSSTVTRPFRIDLLVDGQLWKSFDVPSPLDPQVFRFREDYPIGRLGAGTHALRIVADAGNQVAESDEDDNQYTRTIIVAGDCFPLTTRVSPRGAGTLTPNREPNCGEATVSVSSLAVLDEDAGKGLDIGGAPLVAAQRDRAFDLLRAKVRSEDRASVIVGLRTEGRSAVSAAGSLREAQSRSPLIARAQQALLNRMSNADVSSIRQFKFIPYMAIEVDEGALESLAADPEVVSVEEDLVVKPLLAQSTPLIGAPDAWSQGYAGSGQTIAILDTGVDRDHPFLRDKVVSEACYSGSRGRTSLCPEGVVESILSGSGAPCPPSLSDCYHGTAMAGVAAGRGRDFSGVARDARIIAIQVFSQCGDDCIDSSNSDWIAGLERVLELSADFNVAAVNMSFGGGLFSKDCDSDFPAVKASMDNLRAAGIAPVAASGNEHSDSDINLPACISSVVSVGSTDGIAAGTIREAVSDFSNSSPSLDLLAPGRQINTSIPADGFGRFNGTSLATPHVAGAWAVLKSKAPNASVPQLLSMLSRTGIPITDPRNGLVKPRIQVDAALDGVIPELSYSTGTHLTLTAGPEPGFRFRLWRGCDDASGNRCVVELDSIKNVSAIFEPLGPAPDLLTTSLQGPSTAAAGSEVSIAARVQNQGSVDAGPFRLGFYLSEDSDITPDDLWFAACTYDSGLAAGESETCNRSFPIPFRVSPGSYFLGVIVDDLDRVAEKNEINNAQAAGSGPIEVLAPTFSMRSFVPVIQSAAGRRGSLFTSELTLTNRGNREARLDYTYTAHAGGGSGTASDMLAPGQQKIAPDALGYLRGLGIPIPNLGNRIGTLAVDVTATSVVGVLARTTTAVPEGRAGLAYPGVAEDEGFEDAVYLCGLRQNERDRSNVAIQHMGTAEDGPITLSVWVNSGNVSAHLANVTLKPGGFHQFSEILSERNFSYGYVRVQRASGTAPFYAYGVINDQGNSDGSFVFPVTESSLAGSVRHTLPVIVETREFSSELTVANVTQEARTLRLSFVADGVQTADRTARFSLAIGPGEQKIIPDVIHTEIRRKGIEGVGRARGGLAGALFATADGGDMSGIVIGARTSSSDGRGGQYGVFYNAVPNGAGFTDSAWVHALQQNSENRSNLALVNTGEVDDGDSLFSLDIYDGETGRLVNTITRTVSALRWFQINGLLGNHAPGTTQGYVRIRKISGNNPFLAYGVVNDGGAPGQRSGDGAYVPAHGRRLPAFVSRLSSNF